LVRGCELRFPRKETVKMFQKGHKNPLFED
jgi:hypothetical protein